MSGCTSRKTPGHRLAAQTLHIVIVSLMLLAPTVATAQGYKILYAFCPGASTCPDGSGPVGGLIQDASGNLYGTAGAGGANNWGTVFKLDTAGHETVLYSFCAAAGCADGVEPLSSLFRDAVGNLYGTTADYGSYGATVFKLSASGQETVLLNLGNVGTTNLIQDAAGNFYSTTSLGGANDGGTVFKLDPAGHQTVLWSFCAAMYCSDGVGPQGGVIRDAAGNLYGTTNTGGINVISNVQGAQGGGTVFKLDASGHHIVLYNFCPAANCPDGLGPVGSLVQDAAGNLYGVTDEGGANGAGTVFKVDPTGLETVLWSFCSAANCADGQQPMGTLVQDVLGNLYGTTQLGGTYGNGTVFKLDPSGHQTVLHSFGAFTGDGMNPIAGLWMDASGNLYGTTTQGGVSGIINDNVPVSFGTIFELTAGSSGNTTAITIQTAPPGLQFSVDGGPLQMAPLTLNLAAGNHTIAVAATQAGPPGTQYLFASWSDGGAVSHSISVGASAATYTAAFTTQYQLTIAAAPPAGGTVSPASGGFYNAGTSVPVSAMPNDGFIFTGWTGSVANASSASTSVTMNAPEMVTANFSSGGATFSLNPTSIDVLAAAGNGTVMVSAPSPTATWTAVSNSPFLTITSGASGTGSGTVGFAVAANTTASARTGTLTIAGLTFTVNQAAVTTAGLGFFPVTPCRVVDTRSGQGFTGQFGPPSMTANQTRSFTIPSSGCNIPAGAQAYSLNVTVAPQAALGYLTIWPTGQLQPFVSTLNSLNGAILANAAIVPAGTNGAVSVFVTNATDVIIDINGYFAPPTATALAFYPVTPCRVADTRNASGPFGGPSLAAGGTRSFTVPLSACGIPTTAQAYSLNMTAVPAGGLQYLTAWPTGQTQPNVSTLNALQGQIAANAAIVPAGTNGAVSVFVSDASNVIMDIDGYFGPPSGAAALYFYPLTPCRIADTRNATGTLGGPSLGAGATRTFPILSSSCSVPAPAQAYSLNMTVVPPRSLVYLSTWPAGQSQPVVSTLNDLQGQIVANAAIVPAGTSGGISVYVSDPTNLVIDINGYFGQ